MNTAPTMRFDFGDRLRKLRRMRGLTQEQLGDAIGMRKSQVCQYERNTRSPSLGVLLRLASALQLSPGALLTHESVDAAAPAAEAAR